MKAGPTKIRRGDVVVVDLNPTEGSEKKGVRPCVVVQNNTGNQFSPNTIIVPVTHAGKGKHYPFHAFLPAGEGRFKNDSIALCDQVRVIDRRRITGRLGTLSPALVADLDAALRMSLAL